MKRKPTDKERYIAKVCCEIGDKVDIDAIVIVDIIEAWLNDDALKMRVLGCTHGKDKVSDAILEWENHAKVKDIKVTFKRRLLCQ